MRRGLRARFLRLIAIPLLGTGSAAAAQEVVAVPLVEVEGRRAVPAPDRTAPETDPAVLDAPAGPARAIAQDPAIQTREAGGVAQRVTLSVRGSDPAATLSVLDGVPLNSPFLGAADLASLALLPLESIQIERGGQSAQWGSDAVGGVVDARLLSPERDPGTRVVLTLGSFGTARAKVSESGRLGPVAALAALGLLSSAGDFEFTDRNGRARTRTHNAASALDATGKVAAAISGSARLTGLLEVFSDERDVPGLEQFPSETARQTDSRVIGSVRLEGPAITRPGNPTEVHVYGRRLAFSYVDPHPPLGPAVSTRLVASEVSAEGTADAAVSGRFSIPFGVRVVHTRGDVARETQRHRTPRRTVVSARTGATVGREPDPYRLDATLRVEWEQGTGVALLPRVQGRFSPWPVLTLHASIARAYRLPTFEELYFEAGFVQGNPGLRPEDALTWDAGLAVQPVRGVAARATYFENRVSNLILFLPRSAFLVRAENSGSALLRGVEVSADARLAQFGLSLAYAFLDARFRGGRAMPLRPRHTATASVEYERGRFRAQARARAQTGFFQDRYASLREEGRVFVDLRIEFVPVPEVTLALDVQNLLDKRDAVDTLQSPLPGRAFYGSLLVSL